TIGALVQFVSRYLLTFNFEKKPIWAASLFGGLAITAISYFIIIKGLKSAAVLPESFNAWARTNLWQFIGINTLVWTGISALVISAFKYNIYKLIIIIGTFALAMAFAGNDLVNFIGVPIGALNGYELWVDSGVPANEFTMESLANKVETNPYLLLLAGIIMVLTLWFSEKARRVVKTSVDLSSQDETKERFSPNWLSQNLVRGAITLNNYFRSLLPKRAKESIAESFTQASKSRVKEVDPPAFDMVRAAVNLVVASVLISIATGMKLPLSTTYVTFMVAMGSSLADRAWGSDSAVYRVAGVINVIAGWFMTAFTAFTAAAIMAFLLHKFGGIALAGLLVLALFLIVRSYVKGSKNTKEIKEEIRLKKAESSSIQGIIEESSNNVSMVMKMGSKLLHSTLEHLGKQDLKKLKKDREYGEKLSDEMDGLKSHVFFYIKNLEGDSTAASKFYLLIQDKLEDIVQSFTFITKTSYKHVKNNHRGLRYNQIKDLNEIEGKLIDLFGKVCTEFENQSFENLPAIIDEKDAFMNYLSEEIEKQIQRTKDPEASAKNTSLYFSLLLECKDLVESTTELLEQYYIEYSRTTTPDIL
ncbi:MAG: inorganic phosphate transporter, partial [Bacteroidota bacterium]